MDYNVHGVFADKMFPGQRLQVVDADGGWHNCLFRCYKGKDVVISLCGALICLPSSQVVTR